MFVYILRRLSQTALVLAITSVLVFGGLYLIGDPVEILVNPSADQIEKERAARRPRPRQADPRAVPDLREGRVHRQPRQLASCTRGPPSR